MRITAIDDNITLFKVRCQLIDEIINSGARFDEEDDLARTLELRNKLFDGVSPLYVSSYIGVSADKENGSQVMHEGYLWLHSQGSDRLWTLYDYKQRR